jgi:hypothetical protein
VGGQLVRDVPATGRALVMPTPSSTEAV